jgi:hypothetical protein
MSTRRILVLISVTGVIATCLALLAGRWVWALALYGVSVVGILLLLRRAVGPRPRTTRDASPQTPGEATADAAAADAAALVD